MLLCPQTGSIAFYTMFATTTITTPRPTAGPCTKVFQYLNSTTPSTKAGLTFISPHMLHYSRLPRMRHMRVGFFFDRTRRSTWPFTTTSLNNTDHFHHDAHPLRRPLPLRRPPAKTTIPARTIIHATPTLGYDDLLAHHCHYDGPLPRHCHYDDHARYDLDYDHD
ncbi:hypothetical protein BDZ89DRAFT_835804 [Hymenopellis radicata]|nr:hypothetical protein BDZ89DRAFT_835804 [Hymenopellis radicata]